MEPGMYVHTGEGWLGISAVLLHACSQEGEATTTSGFPGPGEHIIPAHSPSVHPRCHPHLGDAHLTLGPMGSTSTAQMRHKPAKETQVNLARPY